MSKEAFPKVLLSRQFTSFEELAAMLVAWNLDFRQISKNHSDTTLKQVQAGNMLFSHISSGCCSTHAGETPNDKITIALPDAESPEFRYFDRVIDKPVLLVSQQNEEVDIVTRPGYAMSTFSISNVVFDDYCKTNFDCSADSLLKSRRLVVPADQKMTANLRSMSHQLSTLARLSPNQDVQLNPVQSFESQVLECLFDVIQHEEPVYKQLNLAARKKMLKRALEYISDHESEPLSVKDLSAAVGTSERTLRRLFDSEFGVSTKKYLYAHKISGAHRQLWHADPSETKVTDIANSWGFWHMGQFAKDYRDFFSELPSKTLNRSCTTKLT